MAAVLGLPVWVVALFGEGVTMQSGDDMNVAAITAVPAVGSATGNILFSAETAAASAPCTAGDSELYLIDKHTT